jgi:hypothetical protein
MTRGRSRICVASNAPQDRCHNFGDVPRRCCRCIDVLARTGNLLVIDSSRLPYQVYIRNCQRLAQASGADVTLVQVDVAAVACGSRGDGWNPKIPERFVMYGGQTTLDYVNGVVVRSLHGVDSSARWLSDWAPRPPIALPRYLRSYGSDPHRSFSFPTRLTNARLRRRRSPNLHRAIGVAAPRNLASQGAPDLAPSPNPNFYRMKMPERIPEAVRRAPCRRSKISLYVARTPHRSLCRSMFTVAGLNLSRKCLTELPTSSPLESWSAANISSRGDEMSTAVSNRHKGQIMPVAAPRVDLQTKPSSPLRMLRCHNFVSVRNRTYIIIQ